tara:strand:+ start:1323 stop:2048 length:726 start_codon:yes stop_codon:yes gene_type:complete
MAYNYLNLVNDLSRRVNETELASGDFPTATGYYNTAKDAINSSIRLLNQDAFQWPFNYTEQEDILTAGDLRYDYPGNSKTLDFNTFRIKRNSTLGNETVLLKQMDYEEYLSKYIDDEYNTSDTGIRSLPRYIIRAPGNQFIVYPAPDKAYELIYEFYSLPVDLVLFSDVPDVPEAYRHILVDGAMYYVQIFRNDNESAKMSLDKFREGIANMRSIYINRYEYVRDTRTNNQGRFSTNSRVS